MVFGLFNSEKNKLKKEEEQRKKEAESYKKARQSVQEHIDQIMAAGKIELGGVTYKTTQVRPEILYKGKNEKGNHEFQISMGTIGSDDEGKMSIEEIIENLKISTGSLEYNEEYKTEVMEVRILKYYPSFDNNISEDEAHMSLANFLEKIDPMNDGRRMVLLDYKGITNDDGRDMYYFIVGLGRWGLVEKRSRNISSEVKRAVYERDGGCCVQCGSNEDIEYDHDLPFSKGGSNTVNNIQILCFRCNREKGAKF